jgi:hypothetical protein
MSRTRTGDRNSSSKKVVGSCAHTHTHRQEHSGRAHPCAVWWVGGSMHTHRDTQGSAMG